MALRKHGYRIDSLDDSVKDENFTIITNKELLKRKSEIDKKTRSAQVMTRPKGLKNQQIRSCNLFIILQASDKTKMLLLLVPWSSIDV